MKINRSLSSIGLALLIALASSDFAQASPTFKVLSTFDYPGASSTLAFKINDAGAIACGAGFTTTGLYGVIRSRNGHFGPLVTAPNDTNMTTLLTGLNNFGSFCGNYGGGDDHAFVFIDGAFTEVNVPGSIYNYVWAINDANDYCGEYYYDYESGTRTAGFLNVNGSLITVSIPGDNVTGTSVEGLNNLGQAVGSYGQNDDTLFGFMRGADGTLTFPISSGRSLTYLEGINDAGWIVGFGRRGSGYEGLFFLTPDQPTSFRYPGAIATFFYGINNNGQISGGYYKRDGVRHGFIAQVKP